MPLTPNGIFYADQDSPLSVPDIIAAMGTSVSNSLAAIQVVSTSQTTTVENWSDTPAFSLLTASITPTSADSKIVALVNMQFNTITANVNPGAMFELRRNGSIIYRSQRYAKNVYKSELFISTSGVTYMNVIDEPKTLSKVTYEVYGRPLEPSVANVTMNNATAPSTMILMEIK